MSPRSARSQRHRIAFGQLRAAEKQIIHRVGRFAGAGMVLNGLRKDVNQFMRHNPAKGTAEYFVALGSRESRQAGFHEVADLAAIHAGEVQDSFPADVRPAEASGLRRGAGAHAVRIAASPKFYDRYFRSAFAIFRRFHGTPIESHAGRFEDGGHFGFKRGHHRRRDFVVGLPVEQRVGRFRGGRAALNRPSRQRKGA